jgi:hypothetical protein
MFVSSGFSMTMTLEQATRLSAKCRLLTLEEAGEDTMAFGICRWGCRHLYDTFGKTVRDRGITEKKPFWFVLRSLLPTFGTEDQARFTGLSGISIEDSLVPAPWERILMAQDSKRLLDLHYYVACVGCDGKAMLMKRAWYILAEANLNRTCTFWGDGDPMCIRTYAELIHNAATPGQDGLHYLIPDVWLRYYYFFSDDPKLRKLQMIEYCDILDP